MEGLFYEVNEKVLKEKFTRNGKKQKFGIIFTLLKIHFYFLETGKSNIQIGFGTRDEIIHLWTVSYLEPTLSWCLVEFLGISLKKINQLGYYARNLGKVFLMLCKFFLWEKFLAKFHWAMNLFCFLGLRVLVHYAWFMINCFFLAECDLLKLIVDICIYSLVWVNWETHKVWIPGNYYCCVHYFIWRPGGVTLGTKSTCDCCVWYSWLTTPTMDYV